MWLLLIEGITSGGYGDLDLLTEVGNNKTQDGLLSLSLTGVVESLRARRSAIKCSFGGWEDISAAQW